MWCGVVWCGVPLLLSLPQTLQRTTKRVDEVDPEEMERRAAHLRHQRDLLLLKKKKEQEARLKQFNEVGPSRSRCTFVAAYHTSALLLAVPCPVCP